MQISDVNGHSKFTLIRLRSIFVSDRRIEVFKSISFVVRVGEPMPDVNFANGNGV